MSETWLINENPTLAPYTQNTINHQQFKANNKQFIAMKFNKTPLGYPADAMAIEYMSESAIPIINNYKYMYTFKNNPNFDKQYSITLDMNFTCGGFEFSQLKVFNTRLTYLYANTTKSASAYIGSGTQVGWKTEDAKTIITEELTTEQRNFLNTYATYVGEVQNNNSVKVYDTTTTTWTNNEYKTVEFENEPTGDLLAWLQANGIKQATPTTKQQIDLSTLSGWANLASGSHQITVKAKASGYADSAASNAVSVEKAAEGYTDCLTFIGKTGDFTLKATNKTWDGTLEWSTDHNTWTTLVGREEMQSVNKKLYLRGKNTTFYDSTNNKGVQWVLSAEADCTGNIQTLLDYEIKPTSISKSYCYSSMFAGCTNLTSAPELPATTLAERCYFNMFRGCTSLTVAPELPATTLAESCYYIMFADCTSLTVAPELPATTLADGCYYSMFDGCTSLTVAPELPATTLAISCYAYMFDDCVNLKVNTLSGNKIFTCPSTIPSVAVNNMFRGTGGTFTGTPTAGNTYYYTE